MGRLVLVSTSQELSSSISSQPLSMRLEQEPTDNSSIQSNSSQEKKMLLTTSPEDITPSVRKSLISVRNPSSVSPSTHPHRSPLPLLSHTTPCSPLTPFWSTPMLPLSLITRPFTISAEETSISRD